MSRNGSTALARHDRARPAERSERALSAGWRASSPERPACPFCPEYLDQSTAAHDEIFFQDRIIRVLPDRSPLCPGHMLAAARRHVLSMAELGPSALEHIGATLTELCAKLGPEFRDCGDYFFFEHGTPPVADSGGTCIDHAHVHMLPMDARMFHRLIAARNWQEISEFRDLQDFQHVGYAYLGIKGSHYVYPKPDIGSQWIRRQVCAALDRDDWDWALTDSDLDLRATVEGGRHALARRRRSLPRLSRLLRA
jgi:diadenosine tetraphosphate (Ap4A) HIT family hydrolase